MLYGSMGCAVSAKLILDDADVGWKIAFILEIWVYQGQSEGIIVSRLNSQQREDPHFLGSHIQVAPEQR